MGEMTEKHFHFYFLGIVSNNTKPNLVNTVKVGIDMKENIQLFFLFLFHFKN